MKWTWDHFGFQYHDWYPWNKVEAILANLAPDEAEGSIGIVGVARDSRLLKLAVTGPIPDSIDAHVLRELAALLGAITVQIVRFSDDAQKFIASALQPAVVEQVRLCDIIGRAIVIVRDDQLSPAIGQNGQNVLLANKLSGWDIEIMTADRLQQEIDAAVARFSRIAGISSQLAEQLVELGYLSCQDLSLIEPHVLMELGNLTAAEVDRVVEQAERRADEES